jgi:spore maturation protein CgeB
MSAVDILYLGNKDGTSLHRANALRRLGHRVEHIYLGEMLPEARWVDRVTWNLGGQWFSPWIRRGLEAQLSGKRFDLCLVDSGEWVTPGVIQCLRQYAARIVNYNIDDPTGLRDRARFIAYRRSLAFYDLCIVMRPQNVDEALRLGARNVVRVYRSADEVAHAPRPLTDADRAKFGAEVLFLGTWFPERGAFALQLIERGVPLTICGANWQKAPEWPSLRPHFRAGELHGDNYAKAIQCAKVNLGLVSKGNRDLHTTRSLEIPALGSLLCAERTSEHLSMYQEGKEALFWSDADECAAMCRMVLNDEGLRQRIAAAGRTRVFANGHYNEKIMQYILDLALAEPVSERQRSTS